MTDRAVTPVLGFVLLVGIVAAGSVALLMVGAALTADAQSTAESTQAEASMIQIGASVDAVARGEAGERAFAIRGEDHARVAVNESAGRISIRVVDGDAEVFELERNLGALTYEAADGSTVAYQGGGVWRTYPEGEARMVTPPQFQYRSTPDPTLTVPLIRLEGDYGTTGAASGTLVATESTRYYPAAPHHNPLRDGSVIVTVESEYCEGWEAYFRHRTDGSITESCSTRGESERGEVLVELSVPFEVDGLEHGLALNEPLTDDSNVEGEYGDGGHGAKSASRLVDARIETCEARGTSLNGATTIDEPGLYCVEDGEMTGNAGYVIDASDGDVELAVDGDVFDAISGSNAGIEIVGDGTVTVFVRGDLFTGDGNPSNNRFGNPDDSSQLRFFVHSEDTRVGDNSTVGEVYALVYAPNSTADLQGNFHFEGGIVADSLSTGGSGSVVVDEAITDVEVYYEHGDASLYYLHVSETVVEIRG